MAVIKMVNTQLNKPSDKQLELLEKLYKRFRTEEAKNDFIISELGYEPPDELCRAEASILIDALLDKD